MALAGVTTVGEFHYLHHGRSGRRYADPNAMGAVLLAAAEDAGIRITLLDTCYLAGGIGKGGPLPLDDAQRRFSDGDVAQWAERVARIAPGPNARVAMAIHSVRSVPSSALPEVVDAAAGRPLHVHVSEQPAENAACMDAYGRTPTALLFDHGVLGPATTAVHATHLGADDIALLGESRTAVCMCPTTERDLADGIGPARWLADAGTPLCLGSDQHAVIDLLEECRGLEMDERLTSARRGQFTTAELLPPVTVTGHRQLGWPDTGELRAGARADLVEVRLDTVRTAGADPSQVVLCAGAADIQTVVVDGKTVVEAGRHLLGDVAAMLSAAIEPLSDTL